MWSNVVKAQQTQNIFITFLKRWTRVEDVWPTLYKCHTKCLCLLGVSWVATRQTEHIYPMFDQCCEITVSISKNIRFFLFHAEVADSMLQIKREIYSSL